LALNVVDWLDEFRVWSGSNFNWRLLCA